MWLSSIIKTYTIVDGIMKLISSNKFIIIAIVSMIIVTCK